MILTVTMLCSLGGCQSKEVSQTENKAIKIGVAIYRGDDAFISSLCSYLEGQIKEQEEKIGRKIIVNMVDAKNSQSSQNDQVDNFINKGYDVICVNMVDRTAAAVIVDKAKEAEIPIIFFNREPVEEDMRIWSQEYYVGSDAQEAGTMEGQMVADAYKESPQSFDKNGDGKIQYVMLEGEQVHQDALIRTEYSVKTMTKEGLVMEKLASGTGNWMRSPAYEKMLSWVQQFGTQIELVISNNDEMALGAIEALREKNMLENGPKVVGIDGTKDGLEEIVKGEMMGTVKNDAKEQARSILEIACACAEKKDPSEVASYLRGHYVRVPHYVVTSENAAEVLKQY